MGWFCSIILVGSPNSHLWAFAVAIASMVMVVGISVVIVALVVCSIPLVQSLRP